MADQRALLTDTERKILSREKEVKDNYRYSVESRVRSRLRDRLETDVEILREEQPEMYDIIHETVCEGTEEREGELSDESVEEVKRSPPSQEQPIHGLSAEQREKVADELTGSGDLLQKRVDAIEQMYQELQRLGEATKDDLLEVIDPQEVRFTGGKKTSPKESSWSNLVKGKDTLSSLPGVQKPPEGNSTWKYIGEDG